jgi:hypothetical protein
MPRHDDRCDGQYSGINPRAYLADVLDGIRDHKTNGLDELLP